MAVYSDYAKFRRAGRTPAKALELVRAGVRPLSRGVCRPRRQDDGGWWIEGPDDVPARRIGYSDELSRGIRHDGWFVDEFQNETYRGIVYLLPHRRGYLAGYQASCSGGVFLEFINEDSDAAAAYCADSIAENAAEHEREYQEVWRAGANARDELDSLLAELRSAARETAWIALEAAGTAALDNAACDRDRDETRDKARDLECSNPYSRGRNARLRDAWQDGFSGPVRLARLGQPALVVGG